MDLCHELPTPPPRPLPTIPHRPRPSRPHHSLTSSSPSYSNLGACSKLQWLAHHPRIPSAGTSYTQFRLIELGARVHISAIFVSSSFNFLWEVNCVCTLVFVVRHGMCGARVCGIPSAFLQCVVCFSSYVFSFVFRFLLSTRICDNWLWGFMSMLRNISLEFGNNITDMWNLNL